MRRIAIIMCVVGLPLLGGTFIAFPSLPEKSASSIRQASHEEQIFSQQLFPIQPDTASLTPDTWEVFNPEFDKLARKWQRERGFSGTILVAKGGEIVHSGAYGYANAATRDTMTLESVFQLASVTKMFTATAIMMLYDEHRIDFDDPIQLHIPNWPYEKMTIRHLLSHQSGLPRYDGLTRNVWDARSFMSYADVLDLYTQKKPRLFFQPGTEFDYNNSNYVILSALVEYLVHVPFEEYLNSRVFRPLGMTNTYFCNHSERLEKPLHTIGYRKSGYRWKAAEGDYLDGVFGDKGLHSNVIDLYKFDRAMTEGRVLNPGTQSMAYEPIAKSGEGRSYGFGVRMKEHWLGLGYHFGWWRGYRTAFIRDLQADQTVIVLSNRDNPDKTVNFWDVFYLLNDWR
ncbi:MAG: beta-lactamase family protein [Bacteroidia bacterium]|nr:beta-lactamase family protein [Bacteroidia bacterium]